MRYYTRGTSCAIGIQPAELCCGGAIWTHVLKEASILAGGLELVSEEARPPPPPPPMLFLPPVTAWTLALPPLLLPFSMTTDPPFLTTALAFATTAEELLVLVPPLSEILNLSLMELPNRLSLSPPPPPPASLSPPFFFLRMSPPTTLFLPSWSMVGTRRSTDLARFTLGGDWVMCPRRCLPLGLGERRETTWPLPPGTRPKLLLLTRMLRRVDSPPGKSIKKTLIMWRNKGGNCNKLPGVSGAASAMSSRSFSDFGWWFWNTLLAVTWPLTTMWLPPVTTAPPPPPPTPTPPGSPPLERFSRLLSWRKWLLVP